MRVSKKDLPNGTHRPVFYLIMREFAKRFYRSEAWRKTRSYIFKRDMGLCVRCGKSGEIVHHKEHLTPRNINDPTITLSEDNLELLCRECHAVEHQGTVAVEQGLMFDEYGNLIEREANSECL